MEKIIYIVDKKGSALNTAALSRIALTGGRVFAANEYTSPKNLLKNIYKENEGIILFAWRKALDDAIFLKSTRTYFKKLDSKFVITFLIPDHLGLDDEKHNNELEMIKASDYYLVTNQLLLDRYHQKFVESPPKGIFHDLPNIDAIDRIKKNVPKVRGLKQKIIWVGNSEWGSRLGVVDHKGFESTILPLKELIIQHDNCVDLQIVDSRKKLIKNEEVLKLIRTSDLLLQVSKSEGTGLPLLEALGLETAVLSPDIGIAKEVLFGNYQFMISFLDAESVHKRIHELLRNDYTSILSKSYKTYISLITKEGLIRRKKSKVLPNYKSLNYRVKIRLYWLYRYLFNLISKIFSKVE